MRVSLFLPFTQTLDSSLTSNDSVAKVREEKSLPPLKEFVIDVIAPDGANLANSHSEDATALKELKISSTAIRQYIVERRQLDEGEGGMGVGEDGLVRRRSFTPRGKREPNVSSHYKPSSGHVKR